MFNCITMGTVAYKKQISYENIRRLIILQKLNLELCCGCGECSALCPKGAISMAADERGFYKPVIDNEKCISCGICTQECIINKADSLKNSCVNGHINVYGAKNKDTEIRLKSSSGGAFSAFADYILKQGGSVYGVVCEREIIKHVRITDNSQLPPLRGSKYVQSSLSFDMYKQIEKDINGGIAILFSGTPCQCAAVSNYAEKKKLNRNQMYIVDFICYGVTSPLIFSDYIDYCEKKSGKQISTHIFRSKDMAWGIHHEKNVFSDGEIDGKSYASQSYKKIFVSKYALNDVCFQCKFVSLERVSDITMADFWGLKDKHPNQYDSTGVSMLVVNTSKGKTLLDELTNIELFDADENDLHQPRLHYSNLSPKKYTEFWKIYKEKGYSAAVKKFCGIRMFRKILSFLTKPISIEFKRKIKRLLKGKVR